MNPVMFSLHYKQSRASRHHAVHVRSAPTPTGTRSNAGVNDIVVKTVVSPPDVHSMCDMGANNAHAVAREGGK